MRAIVSRFPAALGLLLLCTAVIAPALTGCKLSRPRRPNVLLLSIDSLRADHLRSYGYERETSPTLDALGAEGVRFENAISSSSWTLPAHAAMLTGLPDPAHDVAPKRPLQPGITTVGEVFRDAGYRTYGLYSGPFLHPTFGLNRGFDEYIDCTSYRMSDHPEKRAAKFDARSHSDVTNPNILREFSSAVDALGDDPFFMFVHMWDVHYDFIPPEPYDTMFNPDYSGPVTGRGFMGRVKKGIPEADLEQFKALYDGEIRATDAAIRSMLDLLDERGVLDDTIVAITADHGEEFLDHGDRGHRHTLFDELIRVPLIVHYPRGLNPAVVEPVVSIVDLAPTLLDLAGIEPPGSMMGRVLLSRDLGRNAAKALEETAERAFAFAQIVDVPRSPSLSALRSTNGKVIYNHRSRSARYYDLAADPKELTPIDPKTDPDGQRLLKLLHAFRAEAERRGKEAAAERPLEEIPPEISEHLRALGYLD